MTWYSSDNTNIAAKHQEPAEVLSQLGNTSTPQFTGCKSVASLLASGVLVEASGMWQFSVFIGNHCKHNKSGVKRLTTLGHLDQYMVRHGPIVKQSYWETV